VVLGYFNNATAVLMWIDHRRADHIRLKGHKDAAIV
jgi:hypothetical protein